MRHFSRRGRGKRKIYGQPVQHSPSLMGNAPLNNIGLLHVLARSGTLAGGSMTASRVGDENRTVDVDNGRSIGKMTVSVNFTTSGASIGYYEYAFIKYHRQTSVPAIGTDPVPTSADIVSDGLQRAVRNFTPGWVVHFGTVSSNTAFNRGIKLVINWAKFKMEKVRDGDFYCLVMFNRSDGTATYDIQTRYKTYTVT